MKIKRIDSDRNEKDVKRIEVVIGEHKYTLTEEFGRLNIHSHSDYIDIRPCCANNITLKGFYI